MLTFVHEGDRSIIFILEGVFVWYQGNTVLVNEVFSLLFLKELAEVCNYFLDQHFMMFTNETIGVRGFFSKKIFSYDFNFFNRYRAIWIFKMSS